MAHTVTAITRLLDVLPALRGDTRIQVVFTTTGTSAFDDGVTDFLRDIGARVVPWDQATATRFDLALAASYGGELDKLDAPLIVVPHGAGYNKYLREPGAGSREPGAGSRKPEAGSRKIFGLARDQLVRGGRVVPSTIVLSHPGQLDPLRRDCPEALPHAVVGGDPCYDRLLASLDHRPDYRAALGVGDGQRLVVLTSTWGSGSLLGTRPGLPATLLAALPLDSYRVAAIGHPNVWHGHGPWQVRSWLAAARSAGLLLIPPREGWQAALVAADLVVGDHGSVTLYAAAIGRPVTLAAFGTDEVVADGPMAALGGLAPRLDRRDPRRHIEEVIAGHEPVRYREVTEATFAVPGQSVPILREVMYDLMALTPDPPVPAPAPVPEPVPEVEPVTAILTHAAVDPAGSVTLVRYPAAVYDPLRHGTLPAHLVVDAAEPDHRLLDAADVLLRGRDDDTWPERAITRYPGCLLACAGTDRLIIRSRDGLTLRADGADPALTASAVYAWITAGHPPEALAAGLAVRAGPVHALVRAWPVTDR